MTPESLSVIHKRSIEVPAPWSPRTFEGFLSARGAILVSEEQGFALGRVIVDEAELLTLAVVPEARRRGIAQKCLAAFECKAEAMGATRAFLEVAETNSAARALYQSAGWLENAIRSDYYRVPEGGTINAIVMSKSLKTA